jgi:hypothetical protein
MARLDVEKKQSAAWCVLHPQNVMSRVAFCVTQGVRVKGTVVIVSAAQSTTLLALIPSAPWTTKNQQF